MDLKTTYLGLELANPIVSGSCPLGANLDTVRLLEDAGAGGYSLEEARSGWLMVFEDTKSPAVRFADGFGNPCNNGVRNYAKVGGDLYLAFLDLEGDGDNELVAEMRDELADLAPELLLLPDEPWRFTTADAADLAARFL